MENYIQENTARQCRLFIGVDYVALLLCDPELLAVPGQDVECLLPSITLDPTVAGNKPLGLLSPGRLGDHPDIPVRLQSVRLLPEGAACRLTVVRAKQTDKYAPQTTVLLVPSGSTDIGEFKVVQKENYLWRPGDESYVCVDLGSEERAQNWISGRSHDGALLDTPGDFDTGMRFRAKNLTVDDRFPSRVWCDLVAKSRTGNAAP